MVRLVYVFFRDGNSDWDRDGDRDGDGDIGIATGRWISNCMDWVFLMTAGRLGAARTGN